MNKIDQNNSSGFSFIELLIVIAIIGILAQIVMSTFTTVRDEAYEAASAEELRQIHTALILYQEEHGGFPPDTNRNIPPGLEAYLSPGIWPDGEWPNSVLDWDNWSPGELSHDPKEQVYQISIRFCDIGDPSSCDFPEQDWADSFDINSAVYYCIEGPCRSHSGSPYNHPGFCVNC